MSSASERPDREAVEHLVDSRPGSDDVAPTLQTRFPASAPATSTVPAARFRVVRLHARGGLGEVSVAIDEQLGRNVALKQMRDRFADDEASRVRFLREAEITGRLEHPGIVPVYGLDTDENGRPRYAMRFIHGDSLEQAITRFHKADQPGRDPTERALALRRLLTRFVDVCNAVAYAHNKGVIHRDIKPANIMLGEYGETLVVDWGLARVMGQDGDSVQLTPLAAASGDSGSDVTQHGQAVGTPAFMPPEQARGEHGKVGPAADVFALGATLYCLLTGEPPYSGASGDLLVQAVRGEILPARKVNPRTPAALAAVCHKAMAVRPEDRYRSAAELAAEIERWLADEPVRAYRDPVGAKVRRWAKRNRTLVVAGMALMVGSVICLSLGLWAVNRERNNTAAQRDEARENLKRALLAERKAQDNLEAASKAVDECFGLARYEPLLQGDGQKQVRGLLLARTLPYYRNFQADNPHDPKLTYRQAEYLHRVAYITSQVGSKVEALAGYEQARELLRKLDDSAADEAERLNTLAQLAIGIGHLQSEMGRLRETKRNFEEAQTLYRKLTALEPGSARYREGLAGSTGSLGNVHRLLKEPEQARRYEEEARDGYLALAKQYPTNPRYHEGVAHAWTNLGAIATETLRFDDAKEAHDQARQVRLKLIAANPGISAYRADLARLDNNEGMQAFALGNREEALALLGQAESGWRRLAEAYPDVTDFQHGLAVTCIHLGEMRQTEKKTADATKYFTEARNIWQRLHAAQPNVTDFGAGLGKAYSSLGVLHQRAGRIKEAVADYKQARELLEKVARAAPHIARHKYELGTVINDFGLIEQEAGRTAEAKACYVQARDLFTEAMKLGQPSNDLKVSLGGTYCNIGNLIGLSDIAESMRQFDEAIRHLEEVYRHSPRITGAREFLRNSRVGRALQRTAAGRHRESAEDWAVAVRLESGPQKVVFRLEWGRALVQAGDHDEAIRQVEPLTFDEGLPGVALIRFARFYGLAAKLAQADGTVPLPRREQRVEICARQAVALLERAKKAGFFATPGAVAGMKKDADFAALRGREDFTAFVGTLEK